MWLGIRGARGRIVSGMVALVAVVGIACSSSTTTPNPTVTSISIASPVPISPAQVRNVNLPADDAAHANTTEWWYFNGHLEADDGEQYGFHYVFFKAFSSFLQQTGLLGQLAITDIDGGTFNLDQRPGFPGEEPEQGFSIAVDDWSMSGFDGRFDLAASLDDYTIDLALTAEKPAVLHDGDGLIDFQEAGESYYYTYPRLVVSGTLSDNGADKAVTGTAWMDHQWGEFQPTEIGWDWFSLQLDDSTEIMFFSVRDGDGNTIIEFGSFIEFDGGTISITGADVVTRSLDTWRSPNTDTVYPSVWEFNVPSKGLSLRLDPLVKNSEFFIGDSAITVPVYWEGEVSISGERDGQPITGQGFVELVGYAE